MRRVTTRIPARPTIYNGIQMRSRLEAGFAAWLDRQNLEWQYEPQTFATQRGQYLPDFFVSNLPILIGETVRWVPVYIELKPDAHVDLPRIQTQFAVILDNDPDMITILITERNTRLWRIGRWCPCEWAIGSHGNVTLIVVSGDAPLQGQYWEPT